MDRGDLVRARFLAFVATDAEPDVLVRCTFLGGETVVNEGVPWVELAVVHDVAAVGYVATDTAF